MGMEKIYAADMQSAMKSIRAKLGDDAVILSTKKLANGVEVVASSGEPLKTEAAVSPETRESSHSNAVNTRNSTRNNTQSNVQSNAQINARTISDARTKTETQRSAFNHESFNHESNASGFADELARLRARPNNAENFPHEQIQNELGSIRTLLQQCLGNMAWDDFNNRTPQQANLWKRFSNMGLSGDLSRRLLQAVPEGVAIQNAWQESMLKLSQIIPVATPVDPVAGGGCFAFVGATGVGKTTTIGKLATRFVLEHGAEKVALITTDRFRVAAQEQLRSLGSILSVSVRSVDENNKLRDILLSLQNKSLVLIDTAGLNSRDPDFQNQMQMLNENAFRVQNLLVLSSTSQKQVLEREYHAYSDINLAGSIVTKLDEAASLGEYLSLIIAKDLEVVYETHGQNIPDDIAVAEGLKLVKKAAKLSQLISQSREEFVADFSTNFAAPIGNSAGTDEGRFANIN